MKRVLITGGNGYIARSLHHYLEGKYDITTVSRSDFDLCSREQTNAFFSDKSFDVIIHTAIKGGSRLHQDSMDVTHTNLSMFYNLLANRSHYTKLINLGSGAERGLPTTPYGLSKSIIAKLAYSDPYFYNIRVYAVFDENELDTRFIKANIARYINQEPLVINQNKYMDFFYMKDLVSVIDYYIRKPHNVEAPPKVFDCSYKEQYTLVDIANIINNLSTYKVAVNLDTNGLGEAYVGSYSIPEMEYKNLPYITTIGLKKGIQEVYDNILHQHLQK